MNCPTHTQGFLTEALDSYFKKFKSPPVYLSEKIESQLFESLLVQLYNQLPRHLLSYMPQDPNKWNSYSTSQQIRLLQLILVSIQLSKVKTFFKGYSLVYVSQLQGSYISDCITADIREKVITWDHFDKICSQRICLLSTILKVYQLMYHSENPTIVLGKKIYSLYKSDLKLLNTVKTVDFSGLRFVWKKDSCAVVIYDQQLKSFLNHFRVTEKCQPVAVTAWQNLPLKTIKYKYNLLKKQVSFLYKEIPPISRKKITQKINYILKLSHLCTVSKKCKITRCRAKQLSH